MNTNNNTQDFYVEIIRARSLDPSLTLEEMRDKVLNGTFEYKAFGLSEEVAQKTIKRAFRQGSVGELATTPGGGGSVPTDNYSGGFLDYNDLATTTTPISHAGGATTPLTNDEAGAFTNKLYPPLGVTNVWDAINDEFDWSDLKFGDMVDIRLDIEVTTSATNQEITVELELGQGGFSYRIPFIQLFYKAAGVKKVGAFIGIYMGDANTLDNKGQFIFSSTNNADIKVNGWFCKIIKRG